MASHWQAGAVTPGGGLSKSQPRCPVRAGFQLRAAPLSRSPDWRKHHYQGEWVVISSTQENKTYRRTELNKQANKSVCPSQFLNRVTRKRCQTRDWGFPGRGGPILTALVHFDSISEPPAADLFSVIYKRQPAHPSVASVDMELLKALSRLIRVNCLSFQWFTKGTDVILTFTL